jgi:membrane protein implicated in regulation of membrane protease activity
MAGVLNDPSFVVVTLTLASALLLAEIALPTFGIAGITGTVLGAGGLTAAARQDHPWWPLVLIALAVCLWAVMVVRSSAPFLGQALAAGLYALGGIGYGLLAHDTPTVAVAAVAAGGLPAGFPSLLTATKRLLGERPQVGMDALIGRVATVERSDGLAGTVRLDGSLWTATAGSSDLPGPGETVLVAGYDGMILLVTPVAVRP